MKADPNESRLADFRNVFANMVLAKAGVQNEPLLSAFRAVPRHRFLPEGPWRFSEFGDFSTSRDPAMLYHDVALALLPELGLTTGLPSLHAKCMAACSIEPGQTIGHIGAGVGYYSAILAELVGPRGRVHAYEIEPQMARRARDNLQDGWPQVTVHHKSGTDADLGRCDLLYVCAGVQEPPRAWFDHLSTEGRLLFPLVPSNREGGVLLLQKKVPARFQAAFLAQVRFYPCFGALNEASSQQLEVAFASQSMGEVKSLRLDTPDESCWYAGQGWWLSTAR